MNDTKHLPSNLRFSRKQSSSDDNRVWLRLSGFLSMKAETTQRTYLGIVKEWCNFLGAEPGSKEAAKYIIEASDIHAIAYKNWLTGQPGQNPRFRASASGPSDSLALRTKKRARSDGLQSTLSNATIAKKFAALRRIYRALMAGIPEIKINPFDSDLVPPPPKDSGRKRPTQMIDFSFVKKVIELPDTDTPKGLRDATILAVLFGAGLRRSEVINIRLADLKRTAAGSFYLYLRSTKAGRDAEQALPEWASDFVSKLYESRKKQKASDGDFLFISYRGRNGSHPTHFPISDNGLYRMFKMYCKLAGADNFCTPHSARATAITKLLEDGVPHRMVQEFSRHSSIQMVEAYDKRRFGIEDSPAKKLKY